VLHFKREPGRPLNSENGTMVEMKGGETSGPNELARGKQGSESNHEHLTKYERGRACESTRRPPAAAHSWEPQWATPR
jgi:hypothetical protein